MLSPSPAGACYSPASRYGRDVRPREAQGLLAPPCLRPREAQGLLAPPCLNDGRGGAGSETRGRYPSAAGVAALDLHRAALDQEHLVAVAALRHDALPGRELVNRHLTSEWGKARGKKACNSIPATRTDAEISTRCWPAPLEQPINYTGQMNTCTIKAQPSEGYGPNLPWHRPHGSPRHAHHEPCHLPAR